MPAGHSGKLYILAFDHRGSFQKKMFGIQGDPDREQSETIVDAKRVIYEGFLKALDEGAPKDAAGILVDEQFGADVAREAKKEQLILAMPVEKSGQDEFDFQYGSDFGKHIEDLDPTFSKVLVRYNPEGDSEMNARQAERLKTLGAWLHANDRLFLFELLVPAEAGQLESVDGDADRYDKELRPRLMLESIRALHAARVEPDVWKIEGIDRSEDCQKIADLVRSEGRDDVVCVVLGRGADDAAVDHWLRQGAVVPGYVGFAIGRTIWWDALKGYLDESLSREEATARIAQNYRRFIDVYEAASS
jgi:myo-inositol catabolism protein IolC